MANSPSNDEQLLLQLTNRFRADPAGEAARLAGAGADAGVLSAISYFGVSTAALQSQLAALSPAAPLAWNDSLATAADGHSQAMIAADQQSHQIAGEAALGARATAAGYNWSNLAENIYAYATSDVYAHAGFVVDWGYDAEDYDGTTLRSDWNKLGDGMQDPPGHRVNLISTTYTEIGISVVNETNGATAVGPLVVTEDLGARRGYGAQFVGVVINDADHDGFYDVGEGLGSVTVTATAGSASYTTSTWASGGYALAAPAGTYTLTFSGGGLASPVMQTATLGALNVEVDAIAAAASASAGATTGDDRLSGTDGADLISGLAGNDYIAGLGGNDTLDGGTGNDTLQGGAGVDSLIGGTGDDVFVVDQAGDVVVEAAGEGRDTVFAEVSYTLGSVAEVEVLSTSVNAGTTGMALTGNGYAQYIIGDYGNNVLTGGGTGLSGPNDNDVLIGLRGDDRYVVDSARTVVIENANEGNDVAIVTMAASNFVLNAGTSVETVQAASGTDAINITGSPEAQTLIGNEGANILSGAGGGDTLIGLGGDDVYQVRSLGDQVIEANGGGRDTVFATVSYSLGANEVEVLSTVVNAATDPINLIGNYATQLVIGNYGNNVLNGGSGGVDTLIGLKGDDTYAVGDARVIVVENANEGTDTVVASVSYQLRNAASVETLAAQNRSGTEALSLTGNEVGQVIAGNEGANTLDGRGGADTLVGGGGADVFAFTTAAASGNADTILDFQAGTDKIGLASDVFAAVTDGGITAGEFVLGTSAQDGDDRLIYDQASGRLFFDADGSGTGAAILLAQLSAGTQLTAGSFVVVAPVGDLTG